MLDKLVKLFHAGQEGGGDAGDCREQALRLSTAALLVEMARADFNDDPAEREVAQRLVETHFELDAAEARELLGLADERADTAVSLHEFTSVLHEELDPAEKRRIIRMLWEVALADGHVDAHETHLVRKLAGLLYVPNTEAMRLRELVEAGRETAGEQ